MVSNGGTIQMFEDTQVGILPSCSTHEMLQALHGHLSLVHANFAPEDSMIQNLLSMNLVQKFPLFEVDSMLFCSLENLC